MNEGCIGMDIELIRLELVDVCLIIGWMGTKGSLKVFSLFSFSFSLFLFPFLVYVVSIAVIIHYFFLSFRCFMSVVRKLTFLLVCCKYFCVRLHTL